MTADFPQVGAEARAAYARTTGRSVDGVIALDPQVLAALLWYADPIQLTTFDQQLDPYNAAQFLLHDQYLAVGGPDPAVDAVSEVGPLVVDTLLAGAMPDPTTLARDLGPLAADRRLLMWSADPEAQQLLERVGLGGAIPALDGREGWAVTVSNAAGNKIDSFLSAMTSYDSSLDTATGLTSAVIRVELTNTAPPQRIATRRHRQRDRIAFGHQPARRVGAQLAGTGGGDRRRNSGGCRGGHGGGLERLLDGRQHSLR